MSLRRQESKRPRVCFVTVEFHGLFKNGGIGTANTALALALAANGFDVTVAIANSDETGPRLKPGDFAQLIGYWSTRNITLDYVRTHPHIAGSFDDPRSASYCVYLYLQERGFDIVLFNDNGGQGYYSLLAKHTGVFKDPPLLCVVAHGPIDWVHELNALEYYSRQPVIMSHLERRSAELADLLVSPSQYLLDWMRAREWALRGNAQVVQNLVGAIEEETATLDETTQLAVSEIVFFGRQETRKGITLFCDALDLLGRTLDLRTVRITFLGKFSRLGNMHSGVYLAERARRWRASLRILSVYDQTEALEYLKRPGALAVIPSRAENSPCVVAECLQLGLLFLATDRGGTAELVAADDRKSCLFEPDPKVLAERLSDVLRNGHRRARMAVPPQETLAQWIRLLDGFPKGTFAAPPALIQDTETRITACLVWSKTPHFGMCIESLRAQSGARLDIVVAVDETAGDGESMSAVDASDLTVAIGAYANIATARNAIARQAQGDFLLFLDETVTTLLPDAVACLVASAQRTGADIATGFRVFSGADKTSQPLREWGLPIGKCLELGAIENCFGEGALLVRAAFFAKSPGFAAACAGRALDWFFLASSALNGATVEVVPACIQHIREHSPTVDDGERTVEDHRKILQRYGQAPMHTISRLMETTLQVGRQNTKKLQRALLDTPKAAREIGMRLAAVDANSAEALRLFVQYCCERRMVELVVDFSLHNDVAFLPGAIAAVSVANEQAALELMRTRPFNAQHTIDLTESLHKRARPFYRLSGDDLRRTPGGSLEQLAPFGASIAKISGACPPGTLSVRLHVATGTAGSVRVAAVLCRSWSRPVLSEDGLVSNGDSWWSGWVKPVEAGVPNALNVTLVKPFAELLDLYLVAHWSDETTVAHIAVSWQKISVDLCLIGDITPSAIEMATVVTMLPLENLKRGRLLTDISDISFPVFVPGERTLLHPLPGRISLAYIPDAVPQGSSGLRCLVSIEHAQAHPIEFAIWAQPAGAPITDETDLEAVGDFSGWITVTLPFEKKGITFQLPQPAAEILDLYIATRVTAAADTYFCHAYWHDFSIFEQPRDLCYL